MPRLRLLLLLNLADVPNNMESLSRPGGRCSRQPILGAKASARLVTCEYL